MRSGRLRRLAEELEEAGLRVPEASIGDLLLEEVDHALRPPVHERRIPSGGTILFPRSDPASWAGATELDITRKPVGDQPLDAARRFADGLSTWLLRDDGATEWVMFDRPAGSERDLVVLSAALDAVVVQRHPSGAVRVVGSFGVLRWTGLVWRLEPPVSSWLDAVTARTATPDVRLLGALLEFAVHDLGANRIGALLIYRTVDAEAPVVEPRLPAPLPLRIDRPSHLAALRHALSQVDGAAVFDAEGVLRQLGVRLVPSGAAESQVEAFRGTRHTSGRRYSYDDPTAIVIIVSDDGPVSVLQHGAVLARSPAPGSTSFRASKR
ncbi:MAG TPA: diadenylate cyclase [Angustibacter sp.]|nr:diadenylate cyclase [Angustibacter sp.]